MSALPTALRWVFAGLLTLLSSACLYAQPLSLACNTDDPTVVGGNGSADIAIVGGTEPYSLQWDGPATGTDGGILAGNYAIPGLSAGTYTVTATDAVGVETVCFFQLNDPECTLSMDIYAVPTECAGTATGTFVFSFLSTGPAEFEWSGQDVYGSLDFYWLNVLGKRDLPAGEYWVTMMNAAGCVHTDTIVIPDAPVLQVDCSEVTLPSGPGNNDGSVSPVLSGGSLPYQVSWSGPVSGNVAVDNPTGFSIDNLPAGDYEITLTDNNDCLAYCGFTIGNPPGCSMTVQLSADSVTCFGAANGAIQVETLNGLAPYTFDWSDDQYDDNGLSGDISGLDGGLYQLTVTDALGCRASATVKVFEPEELVIFCGATVFPEHPDSLDGNFRVSLISGPPGPYTITFDDMMGLSGEEVRPNNFLDVFTIFDVSDEVYQVTFTTANGCMATCEVDMAIPNCEADLVGVPADGQIATSCPGEVDGEILMVPHVGDPEDYTFDWSHDQYDGQNHVVNMPFGGYQVTVTDASGCVEHLGLTVIEPAPLVLDCSGVEPTSTAGGSDGSNTVFLVGGTFPYTLNWTGPVSGTLTGLFPGEYPLTGLSAGSYSVTLTDANGCSVDCSFFINDPLPPCDLQLDCQENGPGQGQGPGSYSFDISGGTPTYALALSGPINFNFTLDTTGIWHSGVLPAGDWIFTVTDGDGCMESCDFTIEEMTCDLDVALTATDENCAGSADGSIAANVLAGSPPYQFLWSTEDTTSSIEGVAPGIYNLTVTDATNCTQFLSASIAPGDALPEPVVGEGTTLCAEECYFLPIDLQQAGDFQLSYHIRQDGDSSLVQVDLSGPLDTLVICALNLPVDPGAFSLHFFQLSAGNCERELDQELDFELVAPMMTTIDSMLCPGESLELLGIVFDEATPSGQVIYPGQAFCDSVVQVNLSFHEPATGLLDTVLCAGESLLVGGESFDMDNPSGEVLFPGASAQGCDSLLTVNVSFFASLSGSLDTTLCAGESLVIAGQTFDQNNPSGQVIFPAATANGCDSILLVNVQFEESASLSLSGDAQLCGGETATLQLSYTGLGEYFYFITGSTGEVLEGTASGGTDLLSASPPSTTIYTLSAGVSDAICPIEIVADMVEVEVSELQLYISALTDFNSYQVSCADAADGAVQVTASDGLGPYEYQWSNGAQTDVLDQLPAGNVAVTVTDGASCTAEAMVSLEAPPPLEVEAEGLTSGCTDNAVHFLQIAGLSGGVAPYVYALEGEAFEQLNQTPLSLPVAGPGNYPLLIEDANGCRVEVALVVPELQTLQLELEEEVTIQLGDSILLSPQYNFEPADWEWRPAAGLFPPDEIETTAAPTETTIYELILFNADGCEISERIRVIVEQHLPVYLPTAFSPNGDGINDFFVIYAGDAVERVERMAIFDRWGGQVYGREGFLPNDPQFGWDGTHRGQMLKAGTFVYQIEVRLRTGELRQLSGGITLLR